MAQAWMSAAERTEGGTTATPPGRGAPRAVWTVTGSDPRTVSAAEEARRLVERCRDVHLVWNPLTGEVVQPLPATRRSLMPLGSTHQYEKHVDHGLEGRVCLVVAVVARAEAPFTDGPLRGLEGIMDWLDSWGVRRRWPAPRREEADAGERAAREWARGGHFGHDQVPGSDAAGPGRVDHERLLSAPRGTEPDGAGSPRTGFAAAPPRMAPRPTAIT